MDKIKPLLWLASGSLLTLGIVSTPPDKGFYILVFVMTVLAAVIAEVKND